MRKRQVLIIEDVREQQHAIELALKERGFLPHSPRSLAEARHLIHTVGAELDVALLDMRLEKWPDVGGSGITGADLGAEIRELYHHRSPAFLVFSGYPLVEYYKAAVRLGVAAYLDKSKAEAADPKYIVQHIRALALQRSLSLEYDDTAKRILRIVERSPNDFEAILALCRDVLRPQLDDVLGAPFVLIIRQADGIACIASHDEFSSSPQEALLTLQALAHGRANETDPFVFDDAQYRREADEKTLIPVYFDQAAFIPLTAGQPAAVTLGILRHPPGTYPRPKEDVASLGKVVLKYIRSAVLEQSLWLSGELREARARRRAVLSTTSRFCLYASQQQLAILSDTEGNDAVNAIEKLAKELNNMGEFLNSIAYADEKGEFEADLKVVQMAALSRTAWQELSQLLRIPANALEINGECEVNGHHDDLLYVVYKLLQWFAERLPKADARIRVTCSTDSRRAIMTIEDTSRRLPSTLREQLFDPFGEHLRQLDAVAERNRSTEHLPLYLAKALVEFRHYGSVLDATEELPGEYGHKFILSFPKVPSIANH